MEARVSSTRFVIGGQPGWIPGGAAGVADGIRQACTLARYIAKNIVATDCILARHARRRGEAGDDRAFDTYYDEKINSLVPFRADIGRITGDIGPEADGGARLIHTWKDGPGI